MGEKFAENNFPKKNFQVKFENLVLSGRFNQTPPLKRVSRDGTASWEQAVRTHPVDKLLEQHCYKSAAGLLQGAVTFMNAYINAHTHS